MPVFRLLCGDFEVFIPTGVICCIDLVEIWHGEVRVKFHLMDEAVGAGPFVLCGQGSSLLWTPVLRPYSVRLPRERKGTGRCVRCMLRDHKN